MAFHAFMSLCVFFTFVFLKIINIFVFFVFILDDALGFLVFMRHPHREITKTLLTLTENILQKKTFVYTDPLGLRRNFIARAKRALPSGQYRPRGWSYNKHIQIYIFNNYSSSPNGL